jgi:hypothetical protein
MWTGSTTATQAVSFCRSVRRTKPVMKALTEMGLNESGRNRMTPGWEPGGYLRRSANSTSRVSSMRCSFLAARAISVSFSKLFSGSGNNPPNKTRTNTEKTPNKTKRWTSTRQTLDKRETTAGQRLDKSRIKARFFPLAAIK